MGHFKPLVAIVDFHHLRGPEVEQWFGIDHKLLNVAEKDWSLLPFLALPDGSHAYDEEFSYFNLRYSQNAEAEKINGPKSTASSLFGIACTRHIKASDLAYKPADVTRTSVQKAIVVLVDTPYLFPQIKEKLSAVTKTWFFQCDFRDTRIIESFHQSLLEAHEDTISEDYFGMSLRELVHDYKSQTMLLFKAMLLQPKLLFFGTSCEKLCLLQFALISLIPNLLRNLQDSADASLDSYEKTHQKPTSLRTSDRTSLLAYMGLPLQLFGKGGFFSPYTPLQQLDMLSASGTVSFMAGSTNSLLLQNSGRYCDIFVNLDEHTVDILNPTSRSALALSVPDRRFIDFLTQTVHDTWDQADTSRPSNHGYTGSEDFIRLQFEEYLLGLLASVKYHQFVKKTGSDPKALSFETATDSTADFGSAWIERWLQTDSYRIFDKLTDSHLFDVVEPRHPTAGSLSMEDVQRRVAQQVADLHLDERREALGKHLATGLATGQQKLSNAVNAFWAEVETRRDAQRQKSSEKLATESSDTSSAATARREWPKAPDLSHAQANVQMASVRAGTYLSSWGSWAAEKRKTGFNRSSSPAPAPAPRQDESNSGQS